MTYFEEESLAPLKLKKIRARLRGFDLKFYTAPGVFSPDRIDRGTEILIERMIVEENWRIMDLGCGYGPIGIVAAKLARRGFVVMTDINRRALWLARKNCRLNRVRNVDIRFGNLYEPVEGERFDAIITNPPIAAGMDVIERIVREAPEHLREGGSLQMVVKSGAGSDRVRNILEETFESLKEFKRGGYRVFIGWVPG